MEEARSVVDSIDPKFLSAYEERNNVDIRQAMRHYEHYGQSIWALYPKKMKIIASIFLTLLGCSIWIYHHYFYQGESRMVYWQGMVWVCLIIPVTMLLGAIWMYCVESMADEPRQNQAKQMPILESFLANLGYSRKDPNKYWKNEAMARSAILDLAIAKVTAQWRLKGMCALYNGNYLEVNSGSQAIIDLCVAVDALVSRARMFVDIDVGAVFEEAEKRRSDTITKPRK
jgi:hypothetical protein